MEEELAKKEGLKFAPVHIKGFPRKKINKEVVLEEDLFFKKAVRESIRDEAERKLKVCLLVFTEYSVRESIIIVSEISERVKCYFT